MSWFMDFITVNSISTFISNDVLVLEILNFRLHQADCINWFSSPLSKYWHTHTHTHTGWEYLGGMQSYFWSPSPLSCYWSRNLLYSRRYWFLFWLLYYVIYQFASYYFNHANLITIVDSFWYWRHPTPCPWIWDRNQSHLIRTVCGSSYARVRTWDRMDQTGDFLRFSEHLPVSLSLPIYHFLTLSLSFSLVSFRLIFFFSHSLFHFHHLFLFLCLTILFSLPLLYPLSPSLSPSVQVASDCIWSDPASEIMERCLDETGFGDSPRGGGAVW